MSSLIKTSKPEFFSKIAKNLSDCVSVQKPTGLF